MCMTDGDDPDTPPSGAGFASVAEALRAERAFAVYLNSAARDLGGPARGEALEQFGAIASLLGAASNSLLRLFDAGDGRDADCYAATAAWLADRTRLGRKDAKAAVRQMRLLARHPLLDAATAAGGITLSRAREIAGWTGKIDDDALQQKADQTLLDAAGPGRTSTTRASSPRPPTRPGANSSPTPTRTRPGRASGTGSSSSTPPWTGRAASSAT